MPKIEVVREELPQNGVFPVRGLQEITHIDVHHSAILSKHWLGLASIESMANHHIENMGWPGLGYHYVVSPGGNVFKTGNLTESRWSVGNHNSYSASILLYGDFSKEEIKGPQWEGGQLIALELVRNIPNTNIDNVWGHNEFEGHQANICPGIDMDKFRAELKERNESIEKNTL